MEYTKNMLIILQYLHNDMLLLYLRGSHNYLNDNDSTISS